MSVCQVDNGVTLSILHNNNNTVHIELHMAPQRRSLHTACTVPVLCKCKSSRHEATLFGINVGFFFFFFIFVFVVFKSAFLSADRGRGITEASPRTAAFRFVAIMDSPEMKGRTEAANPVPHGCLGRKKERKEKRRGRLRGGGGLGDGVCCHSSGPCRDRCPRDWAGR